MTTAAATGFEVAVAFATASRRGADSQDRAVAFGDARQGAVVVCDGVGSYPRSSEAADLACRLAAAHLRASGGARGVGELPEALAASMTDTEIGATTLLALAADRCGQLDYCLVGNGMVIETHAVEIDEAHVRMCWTELALPQVSLAGGRPSLASYLPWTGPGQLPSCVGARRLTPDRTRLFLVCTDGIGSDEERHVGRVPDGGVWRQVDRPLAALLDAVGDDWRTLEACAEPAQLLELTLGSVLGRIADEGALEDDATVGALLIRPDAPGAVV